MKYTFFSTDYADDSKKDRKAGYTPYSPTEGLKNDPFLGKKRLKNVFFLIFLATGPSSVDRASNFA